MHASSAQTYVLVVVLYAHEHCHTGALGLCGCCCMVALKARGHHRTGVLGLCCHRVGAYGVCGRCRSQWPCAHVVVVAQGLWVHVVIMWECCTCIVGFYGCIVPTRGTAPTFLSLCMGSVAASSVQGPVKTLHDGDNVGCVPALLLSHKGSV